MGMGGVSCAKGLFYFFNILFWLSGAALLGVGVWLIVDKSTLSYVVSFLTEIDGMDFETDSLDIVAYLFIAVGAFIFVVGFCGCCGAVRDIACLLGMYIFFIALVIVAEIAAGVLVAVYRNELLDHIGTEGGSYIFNKYTGKKDADKGLHFIQFTWDCCGVNGHYDYRNSSYSTTNNKVVSSYCCVMNSDYEFEPSIPDVRNEPVCMTEADGCIMNSGGCTGTEMEVHRKGCKDSIIDWVKDNLPIFIGVGCGIGAFEIIVLVVAIVVCRQIGSDEK